MFTVIFSVVALSLGDVSCAAPFRCPPEVPYAYPDQVVERAVKKAPEKLKRRVKLQLETMLCKEPPGPYKYNSKPPDRGLDRHNRLVRKLVRDFGKRDLPVEYVEQVFADPRLELHFPMRASGTEQACRKLHLKNAMLSEAAVEQSALFIQLNSAAFVLAEERHKVDAPTVAALLLMESNHCNNRGDRSIVSALYSYYVHERWMSPGTAYRRLRELLFLAHAHGWDPHLITGSYMGAFGCAQFIPETFSEHFRDVDGDGNPNPFSFTDAIVNAAKYLEIRRMRCERRGSRNLDRCMLQGYLGGDGENWKFYSETILPHRDALRIKTRAATQAQLSLQTTTQ